MEKIGRIELRNERQSGADGSEAKSLVHREGSTFIPVWALVWTYFSRRRPGSKSKWKVERWSYCRAVEPWSGSQPERKAEKVHKDYHSKVYDGRHDDGHDDGDVAIYSTKGLCTITLPATRRVHDIL
jgi:hypothetical protein